jgi:hypothetical protein
MDYQVHEKAQLEIKLGLGSWKFNNLFFECTIKMINNTH